MKNITKQRLVAIFIGVVMLASIMEVALLRNNQQQSNEPVQLPNVVNRKLDVQEMRSVLTGNRALIEYFYNASCAECALKEKMYQEFVASEQFKDYAVLSYGTSQNESADWMIDLSLTQIDLKNVSTFTDMKRLFCSDRVRLNKPAVCVLEELPG